MAAARALNVVVDIAGIPVRLRTHDPAFSRMLRERYANFLRPSAPPRICQLDIHLTPSDRPPADPDQEVRVTRRSNRWRFERGDFVAEWDPRWRSGWIRQSPNPYSVNSVLRILHSLLAGAQGGFLLHAASAIRNGRAFLFAGLSGAGKTTIARLAPPNVTLLTDEISYVRPRAGQFWAFGTPFAGDLKRAGTNVSAPVAALFLLAKGDLTQSEPVRPVEAAYALLRNILFFATDANLVRPVFYSACEFVRRIPVRRLTFVPDPSAWNLIV